MKRKDLREFIREKEKEGKIVILTVDGLCEINLDDFIKQPAYGILYDLNRSREVIMTFIDDNKWINDYACALTIEKLKSIIDKGKI